MAQSNAWQTKAQLEGMTEEEAQERFLDAVGRMAPLTGYQTRPRGLDSAPAPAT